MIAVLVGSTIGGFVPELWGGSVMSISGFVCSFLGGIAGIWAGVKANAYI